MIEPLTHPGATMRSMPSIHIAATVLAAAICTSAVPLAAQQRGAQPAQPTIPDALRAERREDPRQAPARHEGEGPFPKLIIRGATLIDGTGGPPRGPVDIVVEGNRITDIAGVGFPNVPIDSTRRPKGPARE